MRTAIEKFKTHWHHNPRREKHIKNDTARKIQAYTYADEEQPHPAALPRKTHLSSYSVRSYDVCTYL
jgi:hypothetical protein